MKRVSHGAAVGFDKFRPESRKLAPMAKLMVINAEEGTEVPFLRGMLTRSLQDIGLEFDEAYDLASDVKDSLADRTTIETGELRQCVSTLLREIHSEYLANRYASQIDATYQIMIRSPEGPLVPFSGEAHSKSLELCGIGNEDARNLSRILSRHLVARNRREINTSYLGRLTYRMLLREVGKKAAQRYLVWNDFSKSGMPLLLLIGGAPGLRQEHHRNGACQSARHLPCPVYRHAARGHAHDDARASAAGSAPVFIRCLAGAAQIRRAG